jgi:MarR family transcriptional regulator, 2-MHQ and catechol-resistance regulon repressor
MTQGALTERPTIARGAEVDQSSGVEIADEYLAHFPDVDRCAIELCVRLLEDVKVYHAAVERFYASLGITGSYARFGLLRAIYFSEEGRLPHHEISRHMRASTANISKLVTRLENEGLVRRVPNEPDRRISWVELTETGQAIAERVMPANAEFFSEVVQGLEPDERKTLISLLEKFRLSALAYHPEPE